MFKPLWLRIPASQKKLMGNFPTRLQGKRVFGVKSSKPKQANVEGTLGAIRAFKGSRKNK